MMISDWRKNIMRIKVIVKETFTINNGEYNETTFNKFDTYEVDKFDNSYIVMMGDGEEFGFLEKDFKEHFEELKITLMFTSEEINILSDALLCLIKNTHEAKNKIYDRTANESLDSAIIEYQRLNKQIQMMTRTE